MPPPMMIEKVMIQLEARGVGAGGSPPMMIEKVMNQSGAKSLKIAGGLGGAAAPP